MYLYTAHTVAKEVKKYLDKRGLNTICLDDLEFNLSKNSIGKSDYLNRVFGDRSVRYVFDVSGGDLANEVLEHLDYNCIAYSKAVFAGYSDLTVITNAIYARTGKKSLLYRINNLIMDQSGIQRERFPESFLIWRQCCS